jgi:hypothetical protein
LLLVAAVDPDRGQQHRRGLRDEVRPLRQASPGFEYSCAVDVGISVTALGRHALRKDGEPLTSRPVPLVIVTGVVGVKACQLVEYLQP